MWRLSRIGLGGAVTRRRAVQKKRSAPFVTGIIRPNASQTRRETPKTFGGRSEAEVLHLAQRMQHRDLTGEVPVASFAYEVLKAHPSVRQMGLRDRMAFLCERWERLGEKERKAYLDDPLKGLL